MLEDRDSQQPRREDNRAHPAPDSPTPTISISAADQQMSVGLRLTIYVLPVLFLYIMLSVLIGAFGALSEDSTAYSLLMFLQELFLFLIVFLPACMMARLENRPVGSYGLPLHSFLGKRFWQGCAMGVTEIAVLVGCLAAFGGYSFGPLHLHRSGILIWALYWASFFLVVGLFEEFAFRGYLQFTLAEGVGFWPAAWILSLGFGAIHLRNKGEGLIGALAVAVIGLVFALALKRTGNLWFVVGWHAAFDFGETYLFSVPNSGNVFQGHLSNATLYGPTWLTGGSVGPEGSVFSFITMAAAALFIHKAFPERNPTRETTDQAVNAGPSA